MPWQESKLNMAAKGLSYGIGHRRRHGDPIMANKQGNQSKSGGQQQRSDQGKQGEQMRSRRGQSTAGNRGDQPKGKQNSGRPGKGGS